jgi:hypothetical protein
MWTRTGLSAARGRMPTIGGGRRAGVLGELGHVYVADRGHAVHDLSSCGFVMAAVPIFGPQPEVRGEGADRLF